ncbi:MAG: hypothetical protein FWD34_10895, partial [Oscillospiraceae bacterium]|nr:hypothetical protein [Oscillospiraceae bacterium]
MQKHNVQEFNLTEARLFEQNIVGKIENVRHAFNKIQNTVESSREWWKGGSEREFINDFMRTRTEMERFLKAWLEEYREIMNQVAAGYVEDEEYLKSDIMKQAFRDFEMSLGSGIPIAAGVSGAEVKRSG